MHWWGLAYRHRWFLVYSDITDFWLNDFHFRFHYRTWLDNYWLWFQFGFDKSPRRTHLGTDWAWICFNWFGWLYIYGRLYLFHLRLIFWFLRDFTDCFVQTRKRLFFLDHLSKQCRISNNNFVLFFKNPIYGFFSWIFLIWFTLTIAFNSMPLVLLSFTLSILIHLLFDSALSLLFVQSGSIYLRTFFQNLIDHLLSLLLRAGARLLLKSSDDASLVAVTMGLD